MGAFHRLKAVWIPAALLFALGGGGCLSGGGGGTIEEAGTAPEAYEIRIRFPESIVDELTGEGGMSALKSSHDSGKGKSKDDDKDKKEVVCKEKSVQVECTVSLFNTGVEEPLFTTIVRFCNCFDCDPNEFAGNLAAKGGRNPAGGRLEIACVTDKKLFTGKTGDGFFCENEDKKDGHGIVDFCQLSVDMFHSGCDDLEDFGRFVCLSQNPLPTQSDLYEVLIGTPRRFLGCPEAELCGNAHCDIIEDEKTGGIAYDDREVCPGDCLTLGDGKCTCENVQMPDDRAYFDCHCGDGKGDPSVGENLKTCKDCGYCGNNICDEGETEASCVWDCAGVDVLKVGEVPTPIRTADTVDCPAYALPCTEDSKCRTWWGAELGPGYTCDEVTVFNPLFRFLDRKASCCTRNRLCNIGLKPTDAQVNFEGPPCGTDDDCAGITSTFPTVDSSGNRVDPATGEPFTYNVSWICDRSRCVCVEPRQIGCFCDFDGKCEPELGETGGGGGGGPKKSIITEHAALETGTSCEEGAACLSDSDCGAGSGTGEGGTCRDGLCSCHHGGGGKEGGGGDGEARFQGCPDCRGGPETDCTDGTDNDRDGLADCDDGDCKSTIACGGGGGGCPPILFPPIPGLDGNGDGGVSCEELANVGCPFDCAGCCAFLGPYTSDGTCCVPGGGGGVCGDGNCHVETEDPFSCPGDCSGGVSGPCQSNEDCPLPSICILPAPETEGVCFNRCIAAGSTCFTSLDCGTGQTCELNKRADPDVCECLGGGGCENPDACGGGEGGIKK